MYTRCSYCHTYFKVQMDHIRQAQGKVRCGRCYKVFSSLGNVFEDLPVPEAAEQNTSTRDQTAIKTEQSTDKSKVEKPDTRLQNQLVNKVRTKTGSIRRKMAKSREKISVIKKKLPPKLAKSLIRSKKDSLRKEPAIPYPATADMIVYPDLQQDSHESTHTRSWRHPQKWILGLMAVFFIVVLNTSYVFRENMARYDILRPWVEKMCNVLSCETTLQKSINLIVLTHREITSHPQVKGALLINAVITNNATFAQPFPVMRISLADTGGNILAARDFHPRDYLDADMNLKKGMPSKTPIQVMLEIADPGDKAVNFTFDFFHPKKR